MRQVSAFTVRFLLPSSLTKKNRPENKLTIMATSNNIMSSLTSNMGLHLQKGHLTTRLELVCL